MKHSRYVAGRKTTDYYGKVFLSNCCGYYQVTLANHTERMRVVFLQTNTTIWVDANQIDSGYVVDPYYPSMRNVGFLGKAESTCDAKGNQLKEYVYWYGMFERCYGSRNLVSYDECIVSEEFHDFSYFQEWFHKQVGRYGKGFHLDKDILSDGCKVYAEDTCVLVPSEINMLFAKTGARTHKDVAGIDYPIGVTWDKKSNKFKSTYNNGGEKLANYYDNEWEAFIAYKNAKEDRAKELANKWKDQIDDRVYNKLLEYKVLLTD